MRSCYEVHAAPMGQLLAVCDTLGEAIAFCDTVVDEGQEAYVVDTEAPDDDPVYVAGTAIR